MAAITHKAKRQPKAVGGAGCELRCRERKWRRERGGGAWVWWCLWEVCIDNNTAIMLNQLFEFQVFRERERERETREEAREKEGRKRLFNVLCLSTEVTFINALFIRWDNLRSTRTQQ